VEMKRHLRTPRRSCSQVIEALGSLSIS
jgi:hypothetical protein